MGAVRPIPATDPTVDDWLMISSFAVLGSTATLCTGLIQALVDLNEIPTYDPITLVYTDPSLESEVFSVSVNPPDSILWPELGENYEKCFFITVTMADG